VAVLLVVGLDALPGRRQLLLVAGEALHVGAWRGGVVLVLGQHLQELAVVRNEGVEVALDG
jgi:hypothetical protein